MSDGFKSKFVHCNQSHSIALSVIDGDGIIDWRSKRENGFSFSFFSSFIFNQT